MVVRLQFVPGNEPGGLLDLPWSTPLASWDDPRLVDMVHGTSRHVVRFVADAGRVFALKETTELDARREYGMLRRLAAEGLPAVQPTGVVTGRHAPGGEPLASVLISRYLDFSLPYRYLFTQERRPDLAGLLIDAGVVLLVRLHLEGFFWGDCSLSNLLFRRDAGALMAYLVDAERLRQPPRWDRRPDLAGRVIGDESFARGESVQAPHRADRSGCRGRGQWRMLGVALAQQPHVRRDGALVHCVQSGMPGRTQGCCVTVEIAPVRRNGVHRESTLDREVVEVHPHLTPHVTDQANTSSSFTQAMPCASATGPYVMCPSWVLRPRASARSLRSASRQPWLANSTA